MNHDIRNTCGKRRGCTLTKFYIYCLISPLDNRIRYVGVTRRALEKRLSEHIQKSKYKQTRKDSWIQSLIRQGLLPVIEEIDVVDDLAFWEMHYISLYKSWGFDLVNGTSGGDNGELTLESRKKISEKLKGNTHAKALKGYKHTKPSWWLGKKRPTSIWKGKKRGPITEKHRNNLSQSHINKSTVKVNQYDLEDNFIREWYSISEASRTLNINGPKITMVCKGQRNKAGGFKWKYKT